MSGRSFLGNTIVRAGGGGGGSVANDTPYDLICNNGAA